MRMDEAILNLLKLLADNNNWGYYDESGYPKSCGYIYDTTWVAEDHPGVLARIILDALEERNNVKDGNKTFRITYYVEYSSGPHKGSGQWMTTAALSSEIVSVYAEFLRMCFKNVIVSECA